MEISNKKPVPWDVLSKWNQWILDSKRAVSWYKVSYHYSAQIWIQIRHLKSLVEWIMPDNRTFMRSQKETSVQLLWYTDSCFCRTSWLWWDNSSVLSRKRRCDRGEGRASPLYRLISSWPQIKVAGLAAFLTLRFLQEQADSRSTHLKTVNCANAPVLISYSQARLRCELVWKGQTAQPGSSSTPCQWTVERMCFVKHESKLSHMKPLKLQWDFMWASNSKAGDLYRGGSSLFELFIPKSVFHAVMQPLESVKLRHQSTQLLLPNRECSA